MNSETRSGTRLELSDRHLATLQDHARSRYPLECCGLLIGRRDYSPRLTPPPLDTLATRYEVVEIQATENAWDSLGETVNSAWGEAQGEASLGEERRYAIAPEVMLGALQGCRARNLDIIGIYHSHPNATANPSEFDRALAWPAYVYLILAVRLTAEGNPEILDPRAWQLAADGQFQAVPLVISTVISPTIP